MTASLVVRSDPANVAAFEYYEESTWAESITRVGNSKVDPGRRRRFGRAVGTQRFTVTTAPGMGVGAGRCLCCTRDERYARDETAGCE